MEHYQAVGTADSVAAFVFPPSSPPGRYSGFRYKQELSYRKQIARKLRTQYVEGICDNPVTLKSRLTVTQGH